MTTKQTRQQQIDFLKETLYDLRLKHKVEEEILLEQIAAIDVDHSVPVYVENKVYGQGLSLIESTDSYWFDSTNGERDVGTWITSSDRC